MHKKTLLTLRRQTHSLKPVVIIGAHGVTEAVQKEIDAALEAHELIKIRINAENKLERQEAVQAICQHQQAVLINEIGHVIAIYRKKPT